MSNLKSTCAFSLGWLAVLGAAARLPESYMHNSTAFPLLDEGKTIESQISNCASNNITHFSEWDGTIKYRCVAPFGANFILLTMSFNQNYNPYGPSTFHIPDLYLAAKTGMEEMTKANATYGPNGRLTTNEFSPYSPSYDPYPATNWTSGSSIIYFEGPPCNGEWDYNEDDPDQGVRTEPARYRDIADGLGALQQIVKSTQRNDTNGVGWGEVVVVPKDTLFEKMHKSLVVVGWIMLQNSVGLGEYRRWTYQTDHFMECDNEKTKAQVRPVAVD